MDKIKSIKELETELEKKILKEQIKSKEKVDAHRKTRDATLSNYQSEAHEMVRKLLETTDAHSKKTIDALEKEAQKRIAEISLMGKKNQQKAVEAVYEQMGV